jgi:hypothetical protein
MVRRFVVDASVAIKWLVPQRPEEADIPQALALLRGIAHVTLMGLFFAHLN